jgi:putative endonuclease
MSALRLTSSGDLLTTMPPHTSKYVPWRLVTYLAFSNEQQAQAFEGYLKSGSGHAFARKRLW